MPSCRWDGLRAVAGSEGLQSGKHVPEQPLVGHAASRALNHPHRSPCGEVGQQHADHPEGEASVRGKVHDRDRLMAAAQQPVVLPKFGRGV